MWDQCYEATDETERYLLPQISMRWVFTVRHLWWCIRRMSIKAWFTSVQLMNNIILHAVGQLNPLQITNTSIILNSIKNPVKLLHKMVEYWTKGQWQVPGRFFQEFSNPLHVHEAPLSWHCCLEGPALGYS